MCSNNTASQKAGMDEDVSSYQPISNLPLDNSLHIAKITQQRHLLLKFTVIFLIAQMRDQWQHQYCYIMVQLIRCLEFAFDIERQDPAHFDCQVQISRFMTTSHRVLFQVQRCIVCMLIHLERSPNNMILHITVMQMILRYA